MKRIIHYSFFFFFTISSCSLESVSTNEKSDSFETTTEVPNAVGPQVDSSHNNQEKLRECVFDQGEQSESFLEDITLFSNYYWDDDKKVATVALPNGEKLDITRGGCDHYTYSIELISTTDTTSFQNSEYWLKRLREYTAHLPDFNNEAIDSLLVNKADPETSTNRFTFWAFPSDQYTGGIELMISKFDEGNSIYLGYSIN